MTKIAKA